MVGHNMVSVVNSQIRFVFRVALLTADTAFLSTSAALLGFGDVGRRRLGRVARVLIRGGELGLQFCDAFVLLCDARLQCRNKLKQFIVGGLAAFGLHTTIIGQPRPAS